VASYLAGAVPFSNIAARWRAGVDLRRVGTGTVSGSGLAAVAGPGPLVVAGIADVAKGAVGPLLAGPDRPLLGAVAGGAAVCGHNWSVFLGGAGGRGIATAMGALAVRHRPGTAVLLAGLAAGRAVRQTGLVSFLAALAVTPVLARTHGRDGAVAGVAVVAPMLAKRVLGNRRPDPDGVSVRLARLVLDRDGWRAPDEAGR